MGRPQWAGPAHANSPCAGLRAACEILFGTPLPFGIKAPLREQGG